MVMIGTREVPVKMVTMDSNLYGQYSTVPDFEISLNKANSPSQMMETFWHELIHAIHDYNATQTLIMNEIAAAQYDGRAPDATAFNVEEQMTDGFAKIFLQVITDNKLLDLTA